MIIIELHNALATYYGAARTAAAKKRTARIERARHGGMGTPFIVPKAGLWH